MTFRPAVLAALVIIAVTLAPRVSRAQASELDRSHLNQAAFYNYSEPGDVTMKVHDWGAVHFPGLYEIPQDTRFMDLMSLAGGPQVAERRRR